MSFTTLSSCIAARNGVLLLHAHRITRRLSSTALSTPRIPVPPRASRRMSCVSSATRHMSDGSTSKLSEKGIDPEELHASHNGGEHSVPGGAMVPGLSRSEDPPSQRKGHAASKPKTKVVHAERYLTLTREGPTRVVRWRNWKGPLQPTEKRVILMSEAEFQAAAREFISVIDSADLGKPDPSIAPTICEILKARPGQDHLRMLWKHRGMHNVAEGLAPAHPMHALHALTVATFTYAAYQKNLWLRTTSAFEACGHWELIPFLVELQLLCEHNTTHYALNLVLEQCLRKSWSVKEEDVIFLFKLMKVEPNRRTHTLLRRLSKLKEKQPSDLILHLIDVAAKSLSTGPRRVRNRLEVMPEIRSRLSAYGQPTAPDEDPAPASTTTPSKPPAVEQHTPSLQ
ncbi:hypothetical protein CERSUDRAFT_120103 [Gelatoporia subvermispora B]|uniref:Uncharacterized protein n=1 Tax=Ceriporiopsis subvermispora (strain B) TaxID=914234 RepID=M2QGH3_CERS8|nr:hypothetical protein CERSUDRAFT_120103 [Gelatoporia subvermispora B]